MIDSLLLPGVQRCMRLGWALWYAFHREGMKLAAIEIKGKLGRIGLAGFSTEDAWFWHYALGAAYRRGLL